MKVSIRDLHQTDNGANIHFMSVFFFLIQLGDVEMHNSAYCFYNHF